MIFLTVHRSGVILLTDRVSKFYTTRKTFIPPPNKFLATPLLLCTGKRKRWICQRISCINDFAYLHALGEADRDMGSFAYVSLGLSCFLLKLLRCTQRVSFSITRGHLLHTHRHASTEKDYIRPILPRQRS